MGLLENQEDRAVALSTHEFSFLPSVRKQVEKSTRVPATVTFERYFVENSKKRVVGWELFRIGDGSDTVIFSPGA